MFEHPLDAMLGCRCATGLNLIVDAAPAIYLRLDGVWVG